jgi:hypothetical protein
VVLPAPMFPAIAICLGFFILAMVQFTIFEERSTDVLYLFQAPGLVKI